MFVVIFSFFFLFGGGGWVGVRWGVTCYFSWTVLIGDTSSSNSCGNGNTCPHLHVENSTIWKRPSIRDSYHIRFLPCLQNLSCFSMMMTICPISLLNGHRIVSFHLIPEVYVVLLVLSCSITCAPWSVFQSQTIPGIQRKLPLQKLRSFSWGNFYVTVFSLLFLIL